MGFKGCHQTIAEMDDFFSVVEPSSAGLVGQEFRSLFVSPRGRLERVEVVGGRERVPSVDVERVCLRDGDVCQDVESVVGFFHGDVVASVVAFFPGAGVSAGVIGAG